MLALPEKWITGTLWCAKLTPYATGKDSETGSFSNNGCTTAKENGEYIEVEVTLTQFTLETNAKSEQKVTSTFVNPGKGLLEGEITSTELTSEMAPTSKKEGTFHIDFKKSKCKTKLGSGEANSEGDAAGVILVLGKYKIVGWLEFSSNGGAGTADAVLELEPVKIKCVGITIEVTGGVIGSLTPIRKKGTDFDLTVKEKEDVQEITEYENDEGGKVKVGLTTTVEGSSGPSWQNESEPVLITTEKETELT